MAGVKAQRVLRGTPLGWARGSGLRREGGRRGGGRLGMMGWPTRRLLGVFPANSWLTPRRLGRERIPQPRQPSGAGAAGRNHGSARLGTAVTQRASLGHRAAGAQRIPPWPPPCHPAGIISRVALGAAAQPRTGRTPARRVVASWLELGTRHGPGRGCPRGVTHGTRRVFPCSQGATRHPRTPQLSSFCFPLRLFIGNF